MSTKYPNIIIFRHKKYANIMDSFFEINKDSFNCNIHIITDKTEHLLKLFDTSYHLLITLGSSEAEYNDDVNKIIVPRMRKRWIHYNTLPSLVVFNSAVNYCYMDNVTTSHEITRPGFSIMTTCYNSYEKIHRAYDSLKVQTYRDWEWVILDDSPSDTHFNYLRKIFKKDYRVRLYKRSENSGNIGNVKNEATSLCRGKYILELDHDDEILPDTLKDAVKVFEDDADVGFVYFDFINIYENGNNFYYGDFTCKGYGGYYCEKIRDKWRYVYITPQINNITLSYIISVPNHPRIWRATTLHEIGNFSEFLPICDDHELLIRTAVNTKIAKIHKVSYIQYMNEGNNNFSLIRNAEINRISPNNLFKQCYEKYKVNERMKEKDGYEDIKYLENNVRLWTRGSDYEPKYCNKLVNVNYKKQYCILGIDTLCNEEILKKIRELYIVTTNDFILLDNKQKPEILWELIDKLNLSRMKCYYMDETSMEELETYFHFLYRSCDNYEIMKL
jgi:glycosyltransferase involved in cell wall biosynthesis